MSPCTIVDRADAFTKARPSRRWPRHEAAAAKYDLTAIGLLIWFCLDLWRLFYYENRDLLASDAANPINEALIASLALLGVCHLSNLFRPGIARPTWIYLALAYATWAAASTCWSEDPFIAIRRYGAFLLTLITGLGLGEYYRNGNGYKLLAKHAVTAGILASVAVILASWQELTPTNLLDPSWMPEVRSLSSFVGYPIAFAIIAAPFTRVRWWGWGLLFFAMLLLKFRILACCAVLGLIAGYIFSRKSISRWTLAAILVGGASFAIALALPDALSGATGIGMEYFGRGDSQATLSEVNGRMPLWSHLWFQFGNSWTGVGFGSFWTARRIAEVLVAVGWRAPHAHNGYLDELLCTGWIGLGLSTAWWLSMSAFAARVCRKMGGRGAALAVSWCAALLLLNTCDSIQQNYFKYPFYVTLIAVSCLTTQNRPAITIFQHFEPQVDRLVRHITR